MGGPFPILDEINQILLHACDKFHQYFANFNFLIFREKKFEPTQRNSMKRRKNKNYNCNYLFFEEAKLAHRNWHWKNRT